MRTVPACPPSLRWLAVLGAIAGAGTPAEAAEEIARYSARPALAEIVVGGRAVPVTVEAPDEAGADTGYRSLELRAAEFPLTIRLSSLPPGAPPVVRLRTRLEGWEGEWQDHESQMWLVLRFLDENNTAVSSAAFIRQGESPGWGGLPQNSRFHRRVDEAVVPAQTSRVQLLLVSGGTPRTTGLWAVRSLRLTVLDGDREVAGATPLGLLDHLRGANLDSPHGTPDGWRRDGTSLSTPRLFAHPGEAGAVEPLLALVDTDPSNTGGWLQLPRAATPVVPGQRLRLECEEMHSIGRGGDAEVTYRALPVGSYTFRVWATDELGRPTGPSLRLPIEVRPPFYGSRWFRLLLAGVTAAGLLGGVRYFTGRKVQRELQRLERQRAVEQERTRMARDLHDEMGSRLTQISLLAGRALKNAPADEAVREPLRRIAGAVRDLATALEEIVWAANPSHDSLEGFSNYLSQYTASVLRAAGIRCRLDIPALLPAGSLSSGTRHRLMMAVKEALNNALKHAAATEVRVQLELAGEQLRVAVIDNGTGFDPAAVSRGNGLEHLRRRLEEAGGQCTVESKPGAGTQVRLTVPLPPVEESS
jgi:signal transduction histidine kinase